MITRERKHSGTKLHICVDPVQDDTNASPSCTGADGLEMMHLTNKEDSGKLACNEKGEFGGRLVLWEPP